MSRNVVQRDGATWPPSELGEGQPWDLKHAPALRHRRAYLGLPETELSAGGNLP